MANTYQQRAQQRKLIYAVLILALFTAALVHRNFVVYAQANQMQLRELTRGEVELTSAVLRHTLSGLHGLGVTILWSTAIEKQKRHEWNELELLINSITRLQPYFITPWRFQGWNLAFNVSVECDRPVDKYYYISRGLTLLAHGERRNQGTPEKGQFTFPGNPDLRGDIGFFYQLKIGTSDDKYTMRCLLDMSCIDPVTRRFDVSGLDGENPSPELAKQLALFCEHNPTLSRRIVEKLYRRNEPRRFIEFLEENKDLPSRFDVKKLANVKQANFTPRKDPTEQFPILPLPEDSSWPNPESDVLTTEAMSVYLISRTWYEYAEKPLPPPDNPYDRVVDESKRIARPIDSTKYRPSKLPDIFVRIRPCQAQALIGETLEDEGWFEGEGWTASATFVPGVKNVGAGADRYKAAPQWKKAYQMLIQYGKDFGILLTHEQMEKLDDLARQFKAKYAVDLDTPIVRREVLESAGFHAALALRNYVQRRQMTNYDVHLFTAEAESKPETVTARKLYHQALAVKDDSPAKYFRLVEQANYIWMDVMLKYPKFAQTMTTQEATYETQLRYMARSQREPEIGPYYTDIILLTFELMPTNCFSGPLTATAAMQMARLNTKNFEKMPTNRWVGRIPWATGVGVEPGKASQRLLLTEADLNKLAPMRNGFKAIYTNIRGPFEIMQYYDSPRTPALKDALLSWSAGASAAPGGFLDFFAGGFNPAHRMGLMTASQVDMYTPFPTPAGALPGESWRFLVEPSAGAAVRGRYSIK